MPLLKYKLVTPFNISSTEISKNAVPSLGTSSKSINTSHLPGKVGGGNYAV